MQGPNETIHEALANRAIHLYRLAAQQGNMAAELKLGDYYYYGHGVESDMGAAVNHYRSAAEAKSAQAMFDLAYMYAHGLGVTRDLHLAKRHYDTAAETADEAWLPVRCALCELWLIETYTRWSGTEEWPPNAAALEHGFGAG